MRKKQFCCMTVAVCLLSLLLSGCKDRLDLENITLVLMVGIDLDEDNNLVLYSSSPVFSKEAKSKNETSKVTATTIREARGELEARVSALISIGKLQNVLIGKRVLRHKGWVQLLDVLYRDSKAKTNARLIAVDGPVEPVMYFAPDDKRRLSLHIAKLVDTAHERNLVEKSTLFEFHRLLFDKSITPYMTELRLSNSEIVLPGTALLDNEGIYRTSINLEENELLQIIQDEKLADLSLTLVLPDVKHEKSVFETRAISFYVTDVKRKVSVGYAGGKFIFDIDLDLPIHLTERLFAYNVDKNATRLEAMIDKQLEQQMGKLIAKLQKAKVDPTGLGLFARAYQYAAYKKVSDGWEKDAFAKADVRIRVDTEIKDYGEMR
ncbi:Ger(x)C family spore germination protein [Paenibacillus montanisoli]|uniref:Ger(X)C family spore germination protein n=1 Tax=Paenibacillus montanisoli TaxID=2081970 RepID=A0A328UAN7_9BACL|nr:Ger(x)C family spore germination protein [Paenibacillus montanisoli]RAP78381.1 Ger(x)C family spore germination protein [Paenibacillus montanisoli]